MDPKQAMQTVVRQVVQLMMQSTAEPINLNDISGELEISKFKICRCFQIITGTSPMRWFLVYRVYYSSELMKRQDSISLAKIAEESGFKSQSHFHRNFANIIGQTPKSYQKNLRALERNLPQTQKEKAAIVKTMNLLEKEAEFCI